MDENEFELHGASYESRDKIGDGKYACDGCAFEWDEVKCLHSPDCHGGYRGDGRFVIFVEKQQ